MLVDASVSVGVFVQLGLGPFSRLLMERPKFGEKGIAQGKDAEQ